MAASIKLMVMLTLAFALLASVHSAGNINLEYKQFDFQLREIQTPETFLLTGTTFGSELVGFCFVTAGLTVTGQIQFECLGTFIFNDAHNSSFSVTGPVNPNVPLDLAVVGGTGRFSGATGVAIRSVIVDSPTNVPPSIFAFNVRFFALARSIKLAALG
ncbi:hypothetical protein KFL_000330040 [Klebsormidium nitens]|uniref:Dirigent protein n=1 Tax=Klebsormidium nitens TaxID=105231 RepID=A0A1Y1HSM6_KLENI|nr:hypothetical protein KFL_000330040 [Klebsormidium nitens]|eukprot:GAQ79557.1 hypothetical protein KFL_000330040 [Klebsormidium nitens]